MYRLDDKTVSCFLLCVQCQRRCCGNFVMERGQEFMYTICYSYIVYSCNTSLQHDHFDLLLSVLTGRPNTKSNITSHPRPIPQTPAPPSTTCLTHWPQKLQFLRRNCISSILSSLLNHHSTLPCALPSMRSSLMHASRSKSAR